MNTKYIKAILLSLPISFLLYWSVNSFIDSLIGGYALARGFPFRWYSDVLQTPQIEVNRPWVQLVNFAIFYTVTLTIICPITQILGEKTHDKQTTN